MNIKYVEYIKSRLDNLIGQPTDSAQQEMIDILKEFVDGVYKSQPKCKFCILPCGQDHCSAKEEK